MSLRPIPLALGDKHTTFDKGGEILDEVEVAEREARAQSSRLIAKRRLVTVVKHVPSSKEQALPVLINQINCSFEMDRLLQNNIGLIGTRPKRALSVSQRVVESATTAWGILLWGISYVVMVWIYPVITKGFIALLIGHRIVAEVVLKILEWRAAPDAAALKDISATAQQIDIRLQQFCYWPIQYMTLRKRKDDWESVTNSHPDYIRFYNSLWLVANDVIIGIALGSYIVDNADTVASQINAVLSGWTVDGLQQTISWLMGWPAGLKLNNELAVFLGDLFLWVIAHWASALASLRPFLSHVVYIIGCASFAGASMSIAMFSDLLTIFTVHIYSFYIASARIFNWQLTIIISLFHLFRGRKRNILRNRIDSCDYDLDQLLLGTILFTLLFFLLPTVLVFYITFASARMAIISLKAALDTCLAFLNHFPLFALMLRLKDSRRLPGGTRFELRKPTLPKPPNDKLEYTETSYIHLKSIPLSLREMFDQYFRLGHRIRQHYLSPRVILCLATGQFVPPIHRRNLYSLQYSMLPAQRVGIIDVWSRLTAKSTSTSSGTHSSGGGGGMGGVGVFHDKPFKTLTSLRTPDPRFSCPTDASSHHCQAVVEDDKMHGKWTEAEDVAIVAFRLGTNLSWEGIKVKFDAVFPQASAKDLESRWNKSLRPTMPPGASRSIADVFDDYRHYRPSHIADGRERRLVLEVLRVLEQHPNDRVVPPHPELESGDQGLQPAVAPPSSESTQSVAPPRQPSPPQIPQPAPSPSQLYLEGWAPAGVAATWGQGEPEQQGQHGYGSVEGYDLLGVSDPTSQQLESAFFEQGDYQQPPTQAYPPYSQQQQQPAQPTQPAEPQPQQQSQLEQGPFDPNIDPRLYGYQ
ncbi:N-acetylglucosaminyl transferase component Gpi1 [Arthroderma uncinatum]|uniref:N-acetylglucosaminyl transferase component Gpi1 n=1 Tax=Arthroderma uncinatum TaxID=74035 RepID=UPI00144A4F6B|nr:N-acetylglucosaminyl transferase component Gpi1 [Arthroderma uncinatum]KAF3490971.1 N-acetylglucosaminyl transferase component Gpi1 [Arthroderma uncinatum]